VAGRYTKRAGFDELTADIKAETFHPIYLLWGDESCLMGHAVTSLIEAALGGPDDPFNLSRFNSVSHSLCDALGVAGELPMMKERRVVIFEGVVGLDAHGWVKQSLKKRDQDALKAYATSPNPSTLLILTAPVSDYRQKFFTNLEPAVRIYEMGAQPPDRLMRWIPGKAKRLGLGLTPDAAEELLTQVGPSMIRLSSELEKLALYCEEGEKAGTHAVRALVEGSVGESVFDLSDAIGRRDVASAVKIFRRIVALHSDGEIRVINELRRYFTLLIRIKGHMDAGAAVAAVASKLRLPQFVIRKNMQAARAYPQDALVSCLSRIAGIERSAKGGIGEARSELELLIVGAPRA